MKDFLFAIIRGVFDVYSLALILHVIFTLMKWDLQSGFIGRAVYFLTNPILSRMSKIVPQVKVGDYTMDFSPLLLLILINALDGLLK